jgi:signal transduction histidine kinase
MLRWLAHPRVQQWLPVIVLPPVLLLDGALSADKGGVDLLDALLTYLAVLPLAFRRRFGFFGLAPFMVGAVILMLWAYEPGTTVVGIPMWALFEVARKHGRRETILAAVALPVCVTASVAPFCGFGAEFVSIALRNLALCELALALGYAMWHSRAGVEREMAAHQVDAQRRLGDERLRIAREVHDVVAHAMVAINVQAGVAAHLLDQDTEQAREALLHIKRTSGEALDDLRATLGILRDPEQAAPVGPAAGLEDLDAVAGQLRAAGVEVTVDVDTVGPVPTAVHSASYRIVQEALTNVLRHADATRATVLVRADADCLTIAVTDDGTVGGTPSSRGAGAGVRGMRERAAALGGTLEAGPCPDGEGGWRVEAALPLVRARAAS